MVWETGFNPRTRHTKGFKMVQDTTLINTQQYKVRIKEKRSARPYTSV